MTDWLDTLDPTLLDIDRRYRCSARDVAHQMMTDLHPTLTGDDYGHTTLDALYIGAVACEALIAAAYAAEVSEAHGDPRPSPWIGLAWWRREDNPKRWQAHVCTSIGQLDAMERAGAHTLPLQGDDPETGAPGPARQAVLNLIGEPVTRTRFRGWTR